MMSLCKNKLSENGRKFLKDPIMYEALKVISSAVGVTPEEYLLRFEAVLETTPKQVFSIFESNSKY